MKRTRLLALAMTSMVPAQAAQAAVCSSSVAYVYTYADGTVSAYLGTLNKWAQFCNVNETWKGISPATCFTYFSKLSSAVTEGKSIMAVWLTVDDCANLPQDANTPAVHYLMLRYT